VSVSVSLSHHITGSDKESQISVDSGPCGKAQIDVVSNRCHRRGWTVQFHVRSGRLQVPLVARQPKIRQVLGDVASRSPVVRSFSAVAVQSRS
jgi:hypothetical protein